MSLVDLEARKNSQPHNCKDFLTVGRRGEGVISKANAQTSMLLHFAPYQEPSPCNSLVTALQAISFRKEVALRERQISDGYSSTMLYIVRFCEGLGFFLLF